MGAKEFFSNCTHSLSFILFYLLYLSFSPRLEASITMASSSGSTPLLSEPTSVDFHYLRALVVLITARPELVEENRKAVVLWHRNLFRLFVCFVTFEARRTVLTPPIAGCADAPGQPDRDGQLTRQFPKHHAYQPGHALPRLSVEQLRLSSFPPRGLWSIRLHRQSSECHTMLSRYVASAVLSPDTNLSSQTTTPQHVRCCRPTLLWSRPPSRSYLKVCTKCVRPFIVFLTASSLPSTKPAIFSLVFETVLSRFSGSSGRGNGTMNGSSEPPRHTRGSHEWARGFRGRASPRGRSTR